MNKGFPSEQKIGDQKYSTLQPIGAGRHAADMFPKALAPLQALDFVPTGGTNKSVIITGTSAKVGDVVRFTAGNEFGVEVAIVSITGDELFFGHKFSTIFSATDTCKIYRPITLTISADGELVTSSGPLQFIRDAVAQQVIKDTVDSNNTIGLPVEIVAANGTEINITAGDINIQTTHTGPNPDSMQIGDGVQILEMTVDNEAKTFDATTHTALGVGNASLSSIDTKLTSQSTAANQTTGNASLSSIDTKLDSQATAANQTTGNASLSSIDTKLDSQATAANQALILAAISAGKDKEIYESIFNAALALTTAGFSSIGSIIPLGEVVREIEIIYKAGDTIELFDGSAGNSLGIVTQGGGKLPIKVTGDGVKQFHLKSLGSNFTATDLVVNFIK